MRVVTGYIDGRPQWSENVPASSGSSKLGGSLVVGERGPNDAAKLRKQKARSKAKEAAA